MEGGNGEGVSKQEGNGTNTLPDSAFCRFTGALKSTDALKSTEAPVLKANAWFAKRNSELTSDSIENVNSTGPVGTINKVNSIKVTDVDDIVAWPRLGSSLVQKKDTHTVDRKVPATATASSQQPALATYSMAALPSPRRSSAPAKSKTFGSVTSHPLSIAESAPSEVEAPSSQLLSIAASATSEVEVPSSQPLTQAIPVPIILKNGSPMDPLEEMAPLRKRHSRRSSSPAKPPSPTGSVDSIVTNPWDSDHEHGPREDKDNSISVEKRPVMLRAEESSSSESSNTSSRDSSDQLQLPKISRNGRVMDVGSEHQGGSTQGSSSHTADVREMMTQTPAELVATPILVQYNYGTQYADATHSAVIALYIPPTPPSSDASNVYPPVTCKQLIAQIEGKASYPGVYGRSANKLRAVYVVWEPQINSSGRLNWVQGTAPTTVIDTLPRSTAGRSGAFSINHQIYSDPRFYHYHSSPEEYPRNEDGSRQWGSGLTGRKGVSRSFDEDGNHVVETIPEAEEDPFEFYNGATNSPSKWAQRGFVKDKTPTGKWADLTVLNDEEFYFTLKLMAAREWKANFVVQFEVELFEDER